MLSPFDYNDLSSSQLQYQTSPNTLTLKVSDLSFSLFFQMSKERNGFARNGSADEGHEDITLPSIC